MTDLSAAGIDPQEVTAFAQGDFNDGKLDFAFRDATAEMSMRSVDTQGNCTTTNLGRSA
jgi:hypothetical protein